MPLYTRFFSNSSTYVIQEIRQVEQLNAISKLNQLKALKAFQILLTLDKL